MEHLLHESQIGAENRAFVAEHVMPTVGRALHRILVHRPANPIVDLATFLRERNAHSRNGTFGELALPYTVPSVGTAGSSPLSVASAPPATGQEVAPMGRSKSEGAAPSTARETPATGMSAPESEQRSLVGAPVHAERRAAARRRPTTQGLASPPTTVTTGRGASTPPPLVGSKRGASAASGPAQAARSARGDRDGAPTAASGGATPHRGELHFSGRTPAAMLLPDGASRPQWFVQCGALPLAACDVPEASHVAGLVRHVRAVALSAHRELTTRGGLHHTPGDLFLPSTSVTPVLSPLIVPGSPSASSNGVAAAAAVGPNFDGAQPHITWVLVGLGDVQLYAGSRPMRATPDAAFWRRVRAAMVAEGRAQALALSCGEAALGDDAASGPSNPVSGREGPISDATARAAARTRAPFAAPARRRSSSSRAAAAAAAAARRKQAEAEAGDPHLRGARADAAVEQRVVSAVLAGLAAYHARHAQQHHDPLPQQAAGANGRVLRKGGGTADSGATKVVTPAINGSGAAVTGSAATAAAGAASAGPTSNPPAYHFVRPRDVRSVAQALAEASSAAGIEFALHRLQHPTDAPTHHAFVDALGAIGADAVRRNSFVVVLSCDRRELVRHAAMFLGIQLKSFYDVRRLTTVAACYERERADPPLAAVRRHLVPLNERTRRRKSHDDIRVRHVREKSVSEGRTDGDAGASRRARDRGERRRRSDEARAAVDRERAADAVLVIQRAYRRYRAARKLWDLVTSQLAAARAARAATPGHRVGRFPLVDAVLGALRAALGPGALLLPTDPRPPLTQSPRPFRIGDPALALRMRRIFRPTRVRVAPVDEWDVSSEDETWAVETRPVVGTALEFIGAVDPLDEALTVARWLESSELVGTVDVAEQFTGHCGMQTRAAQAVERLAWYCMWGALCLARHKQYWTTAYYGPPVALPPTGIVADLLHVPAPVARATGSMRAFTQLLCEAAQLQVRWASWLQPAWAGTARPDAACLLVSTGLLDTNTPDTLSPPPERLDDPAFVAPSGGYHVPARIAREASGDAFTAAPPSQAPAVAPSAGAASADTANASPGPSPTGSPVVVPTPPFASVIAPTRDPPHAATAHADAGQDSAQELKSSASAADPLAAPGVRDQALDSTTDDGSARRASDEGPPIDFNRTLPRRSSTGGGLGGSAGACDNSSSASGAAALPPFPEPHFAPCLAKRPERMTRFAPFYFVAECLQPTDMFGAILEIMQSHGTGGQVSAPDHTGTTAHTRHGGTRALSPTPSNVAAVHHRLRTATAGGTPHGTQHEVPSGGDLPVAKHQQLMWLHTRPERTVYMDNLPPLVEVRRPAIATFEVPHAPPYIDESRHFAPYARSDYAQLSVMPRVESAGAAAGDGTRDGTVVSSQRGHRKRHAAATSFAANHADAGARSRPRLGAAHTGSRVTLLGASVGSVAAIRHPSTADHAGTPHPSTPASSMEHSAEALGVRNGLPAHNNNSNPIHPHLTAPAAVIDGFFARNFSNMVIRKAPVPVPGNLLLPDADAADAALREEVEAMLSHSHNGGTVNFFIRRPLAVTKPPGPAAIGAGGLQPQAHPSAARPIDAMSILVCVPQARHLSEALAQISPPAPTKQSRALRTNGPPPPPPLHSLVQRAVVAGPGSEEALELVPAPPALVAAAHQVSAPAGMNSGAAMNGASSSDAAMLAAARAAAAQLGLSSTSLNDRTATSSGLIAAADRRRRQMRGASSGGSGASSTLVDAAALYTTRRAVHTPSEFATGLGERLRHHLTGLASGTPLLFRRIAVARDTGYAWFAVVDDIHRTMRHQAFQAYTYLQQQGLLALPPPPSSTPASETIEVPPLGGISDSADSRGTTRGGAGPSPQQRRNAGGRPLSASRRGGGSTATAGRDSGSDSASENGADSSASAGTATANGGGGKRRGRAVTTSGSSVTATGGEGGRSPPTPATVLAPQPTAFVVSVSDADSVFTGLLSLLSWVFETHALTATAQAPNGVLDGEFLRRVVPDSEAARLARVAAAEAAAAERAAAEAAAMAAALATANGIVLQQQADDAASGNQASVGGRGAKDAFARRAGPGNGKKRKPKKEEPKDAATLAAEALEAAAAAVKAEQDCAKGISETTSTEFTFPNFAVFARLVRLNRQNDAAILDLQQSIDAVNELLRITRTAKLIVGGIVDAMDAAAAVASLVFTTSKAEAHRIALTAAVAGAPVPAPNPNNDARRQQQRDVVAMHAAEAARRLERYVLLVLFHHFLRVSGKRAHDAAAAEALSAQEAHAQQQQQQPATVVGRGRGFGTTSARGRGGAGGVRGGGGAPPRATAGHGGPLTTTDAPVAPEQQRQPHQRGPTERFRDHLLALHGVMEALDGLDPWEGSGAAGEAQCPVSPYSVAMSLDQRWRRKLWIESVIA